MKTFTKAVLALACLAGAVASTPALAHGHARFGFYFGAPWYPAPYYYYPPAYYYPPPVYSVPASPPVYVERSDTQPPPQSAPQSSPQADNSWYYCRDSQTYYPYVKECASPWQRVSPRPPGS